MSKFLHSQDPDVHWFTRLVRGAGGSLFKGLVIFSIGLSILVINENEVVKNQTLFTLGIN